MNKTIEERAKEYAGTALPTSKVRELRVIDYTQGATDQKDIDDKVAFEEREKAFMAGCHTAIEKAKEAFNKACGWLAVYPWYNGVFEEFVKALDE